MTAFWAPHTVGGRPTCGIDPAWQMRSWRYRNNAELWFSEGNVTNLQKHVIAVVIFSDLHVFMFIWKSCSKREYFHICVCVEIQMKKRRKHRTAPHRTTPHSHRQMPGVRYGFAELLHKKMPRPHVKKKECYLKHSSAFRGGPICLIFRDRCFLWDFIKSKILARPIDCNLYMC